jgi:hypothetical protein
VALLGPFWTLRAPFSGSAFGRDAPRGDSGGRPTTVIFSVGRDAGEAPLWAALVARSWPPADSDQRTAAVQRLRQPSRHRVPAAAASGQFDRRHGGQQQVAMDEADHCLEPGLRWAHLRELQRPAARWAAVQSHSVADAASVARSADWPPPDQTGVHSAGLPWSFRSGQ